MLYTNTDRTHIRLDARSVLMGFMDYVDEDNVRSPFGNESRYRIDEDGDGYLLRVQIGNSTATSRCRDEGSLFKMRAVVDQHGSLSIGLMNEKDHPSDNDILDLLCDYAGGSYTRNDGQIVRGGLKAFQGLVFYSKERADLFDEAINDHALYTASDEDRRILKVLKDTNDITGRWGGRNPDMLSSVFSGSRDDLIKFLEDNGYGIKDDGDTVLVKNMNRIGGCNYIAVLTINDLGNMSEKDRLWFQMNPEAFTQNTIVTASKDSFIYRIFNPTSPTRIDSRLGGRSFTEVSQFVEHALKVKQEALGLTTRPLSQSFVPDLNTVAGGQVRYFPIPLMESLLDNLGTPLDSAGDYDGQGGRRLMQGLELEYGGVFAKVERDISGNAAFDTINVSVDGRPVILALDNRYTADYTPKGFCAVSICWSKEPAADIIKSYLEDLGGVDYDTAMKISQDQEAGAEKSAKPKDTTPSR